MEGLSDLENLYGTLHSTWDKIRADVLSHVFLVVAVFLIAKVGFPWHSILAFDPNRVTDSPYFKLAREANLLWLAPLSILIIVLVYGLTVGAIGQSLASIILVYKTMRLKALRSVYIKRADLLTVASTLNPSQYSTFNLGDLLGAVTAAFMRRTSYGKDDSPDLKLPPIPKFKNASLYLAHASFFLLIWVLLMVLLPAHVAWKSTNKRHLWIAGSLLMAFWFWNWLRNSVYWELAAAEFVSMAAQIIRVEEQRHLRTPANDQDLAVLQVRIDELRHSRASGGFSISHLVQTVGAISAVIFDVVGLGDYMDMQVKRMKQFVAWKQSKLVETNPVSDKSLKNVNQSRREDSDT